MEVHFISVSATGTAQPLDRCGGERRGIYRSRVAGEGLRLLSKRDFILHLRAA
jgi:hypothetical protein